MCFAVLLMPAHIGAAIENPFACRLQDMTVLERGARHVYAADMVPGEDSCDELIVHDRSCAICRAYNPATGVWQVAWQFNFPALGDLLPPLDLTGDGWAELLLVVSMADSSRWISCFDPTLGVGGLPSFRYELGPFLRGCSPGAEGLIGRVYVRGVLPPFGEHGRQILVFSYPYRPGILPRSLIAFDCVSGRENWRFDMAPVAGDLVTWSPANGDFRQLVVLSSHAPGNGFEVADTSDRMTYAYCLDPLGHQVWRTPLGGEGSSVSGVILDSDQDGEKEIFVGRSGHYHNSTETPAGSYAYLDPATGRITNSELAIPEPRLMRLLKDPGGDAILILGGDQYLYRVDRPGAVRWRSRARVDMLDGLADLNGDGQIELIAHYGPQLLVLDHRGHTLAKRMFFPGNGIAQFGVMQLAGRACIIAQSGAYAYVVYLAPPLRATTPALALLAGALTLAASLVPRYRRRAEARALERRESWERLLSAMTAFGHNGASLKTIQKLRRHLRNWDTMTDSAHDCSATWRALMSSFSLTVYPDIEGLAVLARRVRAPLACWKSLVPRAQEALRFMEQLTPGATDQVPYADQADRGLAEVQKTLEKLRFLLRSVFKASVARLVASVLEQRADDLRAASVVVHAEIRCDEDHSVFIAPSDLEKILDNLVENAIRHMRGRSRRELSVSIEVDGALTKIEFRDTGSGLELPRDQWHRVFDRDYTTRSDSKGQQTGGFGLHFSRLALAKYDGKILVADSSWGQGTVFRVILRNTEDDHGRVPPSYPGH